MSVESPRATVGGVEVLTRILDGGYFVRCRGCDHPARVGGHGSPLNCPVCGASLEGAPDCTEAEYRASRADGAPHPRGRVAP